MEHQTSFPNSRSDSQDGMSVTMEKVQNGAAKATTVAVSTGTKVVRATGLGLFALGKGLIQGARDGYQAGMSRVERSDTSESSCVREDIEVEEAPVRRSRKTTANADA